MEARAAEVSALGRAEVYLGKSNLIYRVVQLIFTPLYLVFYMLFERDFSIFSITSLKQRIKYFNFWSKVQLNHHVLALSSRRGGMSIELTQPSLHVQ